MSTKSYPEGDVLTNVNVIVTRVLEGLTWGSILIPGSSLYPSLIFKAVSTFSLLRPFYHAYT